LHGFNSPKRPPTPYKWKNLVKLFNDMENNTLEPVQKIDAVRRFIKAKDGYFSQDLRDFRRGKNIATGAGPFSKVGRAWGEARANVTINVMKKIVDSTCNAYLRDPFEFSPLDPDLSSSINVVMYECLREACECGLSYFYLCHTDNGELKFKRMPCTDVIWTDSEAVCIKKEQAKDAEYSQNTIWTGLNSFKLSNEEIAVITHFKRDKESGVVEITKIRNDMVESETKLKLPYLPIIQVKCKAVTLSDNETHWRGYYYEYEDLLNVINMNLSITAEQMIVPNPWILPEESIGTNQYREQYETPEPRPYYIYKSKMEIMEGEVKRTIDLPAPAPAPNSLDIKSLNEQLIMFLKIIDDQTGTNIAAENRGNETAAAVLARNKAKEDALSEMLFNLNNSAKILAKVLSYYMSILSGDPAPNEITVTDKISESLKNKASVELLLSLQTLNPLVQLAVLKTFGAPPIVLNAVDYLVQQTLNQADPEKQQLQQQVEQLTQQIQIMSNENKLAEAQFKSALIRSDTSLKEQAIKIQQEELTRQMDFQIEIAKIQLEYEKLGQKDKALELDTQSKAIKTQLDSVNNERKLLLEASKAEKEQIYKEMEIQLQTEEKSWKRQQQQQERQDKLALAAIIRSENLTKHLT